MLAKLLKPQVDLAALILRLGLAAIFIVHGYIKVIQEFPLVPNMSLEVQLLVGWGELICGLSLAIGLASRLAALGVIVLQVGAIIMVTGKYFLSPPPIDRIGANYRLVGPEYNLVLIAMALAVIVLGTGRMGLDHLLWGLRRRQRPGAGTQLAPAPGSRATGEEETGREAVPGASIAIAAPEPKAAIEEDTGRPAMP